MIIKVESMSASNKIGKSNHDIVIIPVGRKNPAIHIKLLLSLLDKTIQNGRVANPNDNAITTNLLKLILEILIIKL